jgi:hypothetical protein
MLFRLLKNVVNWASDIGKGIAEAEERMIQEMYRKEKDESN